MGPNGSNWPKMGQNTVKMAQNRVNTASGSRAVGIERAPQGKWLKMAQNPRSTGGYGARSMGGGWSAYESSTGHIYDTLFSLVFGRMRRFLGLQRVPHLILGSWAPYGRFHPKWPILTHYGPRSTWGVWSALHRGVWSGLHRGVRPARLAFFTTPVSL